MATEGIVFVVDDDTEVRQSMECVLAAAELPVQSFSSAEAFLADANCDQPCCLVLDLRMPGMGGQKLLEKLRSRNCAMPIIVISGHADVPAAAQAMELGALDCLTKPVDPAALVTKIRDALRAVIARSRKTR